jgi:hypothetical protein
VHEDLSHCDASIPNLAEQCPECRQYVAQRRPGDRAAVTSWPGPTDPVPDYNGYFLLGAALSVIGVLIAASGERGAAVVGGLLGLAGGVLLLIGGIGLGVYIGLRRHTDWLERRRS